MLEKFLSYISEQNLLSSDKITILGVSGGVDSMVMVDLFRKSGYQFIIAHINHQLRANDSDEDAKFIHTYCKTNQIIFEILNVPYGTFIKGNMQAKARKIRYEWLESLRQTYRAGCIATAHHQNDLIETFFMNLLRGAGLKGLRSIQTKQDVIIRPLLFATKDEINQYAYLNKIEFREDYTNNTDKYLRNKLRHHLMPVLNSIEPQALIKIATSIEHLSDSYQLLQSSSQLLEKECITEFENKTKINLNHLLKIPGHKTLIFNFLNKFGFNENQVSLLLSKSSVGSKFLSKTHFVWKERNSVIVEKIKSEEEFLIQRLTIPSEIHFKDQRYSFELINPEEVIFKNEFQFLDIEKKLSEIFIRKWEAGDKICSLGMNGKSQKIKDLLTNNKVPSHKRKDILVLASNDEILAVLGIKISENYKLTSSSKSILKIVNLSESAYKNY